MNAELQPIETAWNRLTELVNQVEAAGALSRAGADGWTVKDHLAHIAAWEHSLLALIEGHDRERAMGLSGSVEGIDNVNEAIRKLHETDTPGEALAYFRDSHARLVAALEKLSDADLQKPYSHFQPKDPDEKRPVVGWVAGNTYEHYAEHIDWIDHLLSESSAAR
ncbi:MAG: DinB family protein [Candidatus Dormibacteraceae bacterium]